MNRNLLIHTILFLLLFLGAKSFAQVIFTNNGSVIYVNEDALMQINGDVHTRQDSLTNHGYIGIKGKYTIDGRVSGNGDYEITGDFINNGIFKCGRGTVILKGEAQLITGDSASTFFDLVLKDSVGQADIKRMENGVTVKNILNLTNCELATDNFKLYITSINRHAIKRDAGFVSSTGIGRLIRYTGLPETYLFPVGSSKDTLRYRPVEVTPHDSALHIIAVRMVNHNADFDGYDRDKSTRDLCFLNPLYYHLIDRISGIDSVDVTVYFDAQKDGVGFNTLGHWQGGVSPMWTSILPTISKFYPLTGFTKAKWSDFSFEPFIIAQTYPDSVPVTGDRFVCSHTPYNFDYSAWGSPQSRYLWTIEGADLKSTDTTLHTLSLVWLKPGYHTILVREKHPESFCPSDTSRYVVYVNPRPVVDFSHTSEYSPRLEYFAWDLISFTNLSTNDSLYAWDFDDAKSSTQKNPYHMFEEPGVYDVFLQVTSDSGCVDTLTKSLTIKEGLFIPNVFTPNADGENDLFVVRNSGLVEYAIVIYDRWGVVVFETLYPTMHWDGRTPAGKESAEGTYYYVLKARTELEEFNRTGYLTLLR